VKLNSANRRIYRIYRVCIRLPIIVPDVLIAIADVFGLSLARGPLIVEMLGYSLYIGGLPYTLLAAWATWWIGGQPEEKIRRLMFRAPLLMVAIFVPFALLVGFTIAFAYRDAWTVYAGVALYSAAVILLLGYGYVGLAVFLRYTFGPRQSLA